ncbi:invasion associated locus B family protein [Jannaschia sp. LMIT008]|uniref:invasion associated locus B family protein n=1 Tax=Jannaschia maritima TaxID=3032585 RepID=UPI002811F7CD|nr:invasion associated locus B family protein [Jannaschia sp. LMIT008]
MTRTLTLLAALILSAAPMGVVAQDTDATDSPPEAPAVDAPAPQGTDAPAPGGALATGETTEPPAAQPSTEEIYVREEHGDWEVRCLQAPEGQPDPCQLYQRLEDANGNPTADVNFFDLPDGGELAGGATVLTPLRTLLTAQVTVSVDGGQARRYPFAFCDEGGCYARLGFTQDDMNRFRRGAMAQITVVPALAPDQPAQMDMSLRGFTAGIAAVEVTE